MLIVLVRSDGYLAAAEPLKVLSAPARPSIVVEPAEQPRHARELVERLEMRQPVHHGKEEQ